MTRTLPPMLAMRNGVLLGGHILPDGQQDGRPDGHYLQHIGAERERGRE